MADTEAMSARVHDHDLSTATPAIACRNNDMPKGDGKQSAIRAPRSAKVVMPFEEDMSDEAMAAFHKRMDVEYPAKPARPTASRSA